METRGNTRGGKPTIVRFLRLCLLGLVASIVGCKSTMSVQIPFVEASVPILKPELLFDQAHGQKFSIEEKGPLDLSQLAATLKEQGFDIETNREPLTEELLSGTNALIISGPVSALEPEEVDAVVDFVEDGGRLCVMLHIAWPVSDLLGRLGVSVSSGVIQEREDLIEGRPLNFRVFRLEPHEITEDLRAVTVLGSWALLPRSEEAKIIAQTGPTAWVDVDGDGRLSSGDTVGSFGVAVAGERGDGHFVVFGDNEMFQNQFLRKYNPDLAMSLAKWLAD